MGVAHTPPSPRAFVRTVLGDVEPESLGVVLPHEHVFVDARVWAAAGASHEKVTPDNRAEVERDATAYLDCLVLDDPDVAYEELIDFRQNGGGGIADVSPEGVGRKPRELQALSRATGIHVIAGCGPYVQSTHHPRLRTLTAEEVARELVGEITVGLDGTDVRAGVIGEIGTSDPVTPDESKALAAAAIAQQATGCAITIHVHMGARTCHEILSTIEGAGGDLSRVVLGHLDVQLSRDFDPETAIDYHIELAKRGCYIEYDLCGLEAYVQLPTGISYHHATDIARVRAIVHLVDGGFASQLLLSHDIAKKIQLKRYGGTGYSHTLCGFRDQLRNAGLSDGILDSIYKDNPQRLFAIDGSHGI